MKLKPEDIVRIEKKMHAATNLRDGSGSARIIVHMGTCGIASGARPIMKAFMDELERSGRTDILFTTSGCAGLCSHEPMATIERKGETPIKYIELTPEKVHEIFEKHVINGTIIKEYALAKGSERMA